MIKDVGFDGVELNSTVEFAKLELLDTKAKSGIELSGVVSIDHWAFPLNDPDPEVRKKSYSL